MAAITADFIAEQNRPLLAGHRRGFRGARAPAGARRARPRGAGHRGDGVRGGDPDLGRRHGRHPLCTLSRRRRAARPVRQAGRLRRHPSPDPGDADGFAAFPVGQGEGLRRAARDGQSHGLAFDAVNSNTFQDQPGQALSYKFGSLSHVDKAVRDQAIAHNLECIEIGKAIGSKAMTVWIADGSNFAGQSNLAAPRSLSRLDARSAARCLPTGGCSSSTSCTSRRSIRRSWPIGAPASRGAATRAEGAVPGRPRPSCAERQYRADRRPAGALRQTRRLPFQRLQIRRRRSRRRLGVAVPSVPGVQ